MTPSCVVCCVALASDRRDRRQAAALCGLYNQKVELGSTLTAREGCGESHHWITGVSLKINGKCCVFSEHSLTVNVVVVVVD